EYRDLKIDVSLDCFIPKNYIENEESRFGVYEQISNLKTFDEEASFESMLEKKFGEIPNSVKNLCFVAVLKNVFLTFFAKRIVIGSENSFVEFYDKSGVDNEKVLNILSKNKRVLSLKFKSLPIIEFKLVGDNLSKIKQIINIFTNI
ncbi:MAG: TRCF domain-containing protein, partial [Christensenellales bacterium]